MSVDRKKLEALLKWYIQEIGKDLIAVIIVNREGLVIEALSGKSSWSTAGFLISSFNSSV